MAENKWVNWGFTTPRSGVITLHITGNGPFGRILLATHGMVKNPGEAAISGGWVIFTLPSWIFLSLNRIDPKIFSAHSRHLLQDHSKTCVNSAYPWWQMVDWGQGIGRDLEMSFSPSWIEWVWILNQSKKIPRDPWNIPQILKIEIWKDFLHKQVIEGYVGVFLESVDFCCMHWVWPPLSNSSG